MNPILPCNHFVPDGEARVMPDGRLYLYGSYDISGELSYGSNVLHVFSTDNMTDWVDHGVCLKSEDIPWATEENLMYAPDCIFKDGKYYLFFCMSGGIEGVAVSDSPYGYFHDPTPIEGADGVSIDPSLLVDDDGQVYYYFGQFHLCGAKLNSDMKSLDLSTLNTNIIDEKQHGFHEGSSIRKIGDTYYLLYTDTSRGRATCLSYATSKSPLGPYTKQGVIIDNTFCDPCTWNNHGSMCCYNGKWYIFYHRSSQNSVANRRMCVEPIAFDDEGFIKEVPMTTMGCEKPMTTDRKYSAASACLIRNGAYIIPNVVFDSKEDSSEILTHIQNGTWAAYKYFDFAEPKKMEFIASSAIGGGTIEIWADNLVIGRCEVKPTGGWTQFASFSCELKAVSGIKTLYLCFQGNKMYRRIMDVASFSFSS